MKSRKNILAKGFIVVCLSLMVAAVIIWTKSYINNERTTIVICDTRYDLFVSEIDLSGKDVSVEIDKLLKLTALERADLTDTDITPEQYDSIHSALPYCNIKWSVPVGSERYPNDITTLTLLENVSASDLKNIGYFTQLEFLDATGYPLCDELFDATHSLRESDSGSRCAFSGKLYGKPIDDSSEKFDFSSKSITDLSEFYNVLRFFPNVKEIYLGDVGVPDEEADKLNKAFPNTKIVWLVEFGRWQARTDIRVFSTLIGVSQRQTFDEKELFPLLAYCTELRALDLGHNHLADISLIGNLTDLEILIIAENKMENLEPIGKLKKLNALEVYNCPQIDDLSPLGNCTELDRLMIINDGSVKNIKALKNCKKLNLIYAKRTLLDDYTWEELRKDLPGCDIDTKTYITKGVWRDSVKGRAVGYAFSNWTNIKTYNHWDDFTLGKKEVGRRIK